MSILAAHGKGELVRDGLAHEARAGIEKPLDGRRRAGFDAR
jgi:hypothetical protein